MGELYKRTCIGVNKQPCLLRNNSACILHGMKYGERLKAARKYAGITQAELAERIDNVVTQAGISYLENSEATGSEFTAQFSEACGVRPMWLASEKGEMTDGLYVQDPKAKAVLMAMQQMPEYKKDMLVAASNTLAEQPDQGATGTK